MTTSTRTLPPGALTLATVGSGMLSTGVSTAAHASQPTTITTAITTLVLTLAAVGLEVYREKLRHDETMFALGKAGTDAKFDVTKAIAVLRGTRPEGEEAARQEPTNSRRTPPRSRVPKRPVPVATPIIAKPSTEILAVDEAVEDDAILREGDA